ncbi:tetratricopeptide repeat protein [Streptomyces sp. CC208A]|uniref:tetratricopeptide repeat protein n=1 Tax=Streptomyces sp. CC208A TaxID=3044573 RepID=UPI0024A9B81C|nr:tetratricopeptide repeat protein [Streptomyces sp. CC208A]
MRHEAQAALDRGDFARSAQLFAQFLDRADDGDAETLAARQQYALALYGLSDHPAGEAQLRRVVEGRERLLGPDHPSTLTALARLAEALGQQQRWLEAQALAQEAVRRGTRTLGAQHEATLSGRLALAWILARTGDEDADAFVRETAHAIDSVLGRDHRDSWAAHHLRIDLLRSLDRLEEAEAEAREIIAIREQHQGGDHPHTLRAHADLALVLHASGHTADALTMIEAVLNRSTQALGPEHPFTSAFRSDRETIAG